MVALVAALLLADGPVFRTAKTDVTPPEPLPLGGYTARGDKLMELGGDPLYARTLVFEEGETRIAIVSLEALTIPESLVATVKSKIPTDVRLMLVATHTHCAPDSQMLNERMTFKVPGIASFSRRWLDWYAARIADCVNEALIARAESASTLGISVEDVDANRGRREGALPEKAATWLSSSGKPLITIYAAHATLYGEDRLTTSGDWPGAVAGQMGGIVLPGAIGDVSPHAEGTSPVENVARIVEKLRQGLKRSIRTGAFERSSSIAFVSEPVLLTKPTPHPEFSTEFGAPSPLDQLLVGRFAPTEASLTIVKVGGIVMVGVPGEPTSEIGRRIQSMGASLGFPRTVTVSHCNGWIGYILEPEDYDRGGYEAALSFHGRETSQRVLKAAERGLKRLAQAARLTKTR